MAHLTSACCVACEAETDEEYLRDNKAESNSSIIGVKSTEFIPTRIPTKSIWRRGIQSYNLLALPIALTICSTNHAVWRGDYGRGMHTAG